MKQLFALGLLLFLLQSCFTNKELSTEPESHINVVHLKNGLSRLDSVIVYALPQTRLRFKITATKTIKKQGPLYRYSERFIGINNVILRDELSYKIKHVELETVSEPDPEQYYQVNFSGSSIAPLVSVNELGCIVSVNADPIPKENVINTSPKPDSPLDTSFKYTPLLEDQLVVNSTAKMAEEAANFLYRLRDNRAALVSGELDFYPADGKALALGLEEIKRLESEFLSLFVGKEATQEVVYYVDYLPQVPVNNVLAFRFSQYKGLVDKGDLSGSPVYLSVQTMIKNLEKNDTVNVNGNKGFYYRIPQQSNVTLNEGKTLLLNQNTLIAQFGTVLSLPENLFAEPNISILFHEETGALNKIYKR